MFSRRLSLHSLGLHCSLSTFSRFEMLFQLIKFNSWK